MNQRRVVRIDPVAPEREMIERAAAILKSGGVIGFPTETFYGLGAAALDPRAVRRVFRLKGRPATKPLSVLVDSHQMVESVAAEISPSARALMERHWPGPLTLVLRARTSVPEEVTGGTGTIGVRLCAYPIAVALVGALGAPVTAPSANVTDGQPPTTAREVLDYFGTALDLLLDGGPTRGGSPSTVLDVTVDPPAILRQGVVRP